MSRRFGLIVLVLVTASVGFLVGTGAAVRSAPSIIGDHLPDYHVDYLVFNDAGTYRARKSIDGSLLATTSTDDVSAVINAADDNATSPALIGLPSGTFNAKTQISLDTGTGLIGTGSDFTNIPSRYTVIKASSTFSPNTNALVITDGTGVNSAGNSSLRNIALDAGDYADSALKVDSLEVRLDGVALSGGRTYTLHVNSNRGMADLVTAREGNGTPTTGLYVENGLDWNWVNLRVVGGSYTTVVDLSNAQGHLIDTGHFTGGISTTTNTRIGGTRNRLVNIYFDTVRSGPLVENAGGDNLVASSWFKATQLLSDDTYSMVKVSAGDFVLVGSQSEVGTNRWKWGFEISGTGSVTTVVGNQFRGVAQATIWNVEPTAHDANTRNGVGGID
jgi:hypothetical protein